MTEQKVIAIATKVYNNELWGEAQRDKLMRFAKMVAEHEREACIAHAITSAEKAIDVAIKLEREECAVIAEEWYCGCGRGSCPEGDLRAQDIAATIRAKGEQE